VLNFARVRWRYLLAETSAPGASRLATGLKGHASQFVKDRRTFKRKRRGLFEIGAELRDLPLQPVERHLPHGRRLRRSGLLGSRWRSNDHRDKPTMTQGITPEDRAVPNATGLSRGARRWRRAHGIGPRQPAKRPWLAAARPRCAIQQYRRLTASDARIPG
jgi:hypothetical protein